MHRITPYLLLVFILPALELSAQRVNSIGVEIPEDAAPPERQRLRFFEMDGTYMEWFKTIYKRSPATNLISEPLVRQDHNYDLVPAAAKSWEGHAGRQYVALPPAVRDAVGRRPALHRP